MADNIETFSNMTSEFQKIQSTDNRTQVTNIMTALQTKVGKDIPTFMRLVSEFQKLETEKAKSEAIKALRTINRQLQDQEEALQMQINQALAEEREKRDQEEQERIRIAVEEALHQEREPRQPAAQITAENG